jgi:hypothetical protein
LESPLGGQVRNESGHQSSTGSESADAVLMPVKRKRGRPRKAPEVN